MNSTVLRITTLSRADHADICRALTAIGETCDGEHSCGVYVTTSDPVRVVKALHTCLGVTGCWASHRDLMIGVPA